MGNVGGKRDEGSSSGTKSEESVFMEFADGLFPESMVQSTSHSPTPNRSPLMFTPQVPMVVPQGLGNTVQTQHITTEYANMPSDKGIPTMITWAYDGSQVAIEGSWDNWKTREFLQRSGREFTIMKVLRSGVYHYRFIVDGQWKHAPELPQQLDEKGNIFNVLDLKFSEPRSFYLLTLKLQKLAHRALYRFQRKRVTLGLPGFNPGQFTCYLYHFACDYAG